MSQLTKEQLENLSTYRLLSLYKSVRSFGCYWDSELDRYVKYASDYQKLIKSLLDKREHVPRKKRKPSKSRGNRKPFKYYRRELLHAIKDFQPEYNELIRAVEHMAWLQLLTYIQKNANWIYENKDLWSIVDNWWSSLHRIYWSRSFTHYNYPSSLGERLKIVGE